MTEALAIICAVSDVAILGWLIGTWFYEGHHKRCKVDMLVTCKSCGNEIQVEADCAADHRNDE